MKHAIKRYYMILIISFFIILHFTAYSQVANFVIPDTICVNQNITIQNTSTGGSTYYWNFCSGSLSTTPIGLNIGNLGTLSNPVYSVIVKDGNNYYVFITNHVSGTLTRLSFGTSLINTPVATNLGSLGAIGQYAEGIQIKKDSVSGNWIGLIVGGQNNDLVRLNFGNSLSNTPTGANLGNINGLLSYPHTIYTFKEGGNWYSIVGNYNISTLIRLNFGNSLSNIPTATNIGNFGVLNGPDGFYPIQENGIWYIFVVNRNSNTLSRLNFGTSLLNTPTGINIGNIGGNINTPRSITIIKDCGKVFGFVVNEIPNDIVRLTFPNGLLSLPTGVSLGNIANFSFPHHISELFRVGDSLYTFIMNVYNSTISRLCFPSCNNSSISSSILQTPPVFSYNSPGTYNVSLTVNEGLPTQSNFCKQVVVVETPTISLSNDTTICKGQSVVLTGSSGSQNICSKSDLSLNLQQGLVAFYPFCGNATDESLNGHNGVVSGATLTNDRFGNTNSAYNFNGINNYITVADHPTLKPSEVSISVWVKLNSFTCTQTAGNTDMSSVIFKKNSSSSYFEGYMVGYRTDLHKFHGLASNSGSQATGYSNTAALYVWKHLVVTINSTQLKFYDNGVLMNTITTGFPLDYTNIPLYFGSTQQSYNGFFNGVIDDIFIYNRILSNSEVLQLYNLSQVNLQNHYSWSTGDTTQSISVSPAQTTTYFLSVLNGSCSVMDSATVNIIPLPIIDLGNDTTICNGNGIVLDAANPGCTYLWNTGQTSQTLNVTSSGTYSVKVTNNGGCIAFDTITVNFIPGLSAHLGNDTTICQGNSLILNAQNPGCTYLWNGGLTSQTINVTSSGIYTVKVTNGNGCYARDTISVNVVSNLTVQLGNDTTICQGEVLLLNAGYSGSIYQWNTGLNSQTIQVQNSGLYWVKVIMNSCNGTDSIHINVIPQPVISLGNDTIMCPGELILLSPGPGFNQYHWSDGSVLNYLNVYNPGTYTVSVTDGICTATDAVFIDECSSEIWVPNVFTPNGDGVNECFFPVCTNIDNISLYVFNRWGNMVFKAEGKLTIWDGKYKGELCSVGVYYYLIEYENKGSVRGMRQIHGSVTLLR